MKYMLSDPPGRRADAGRSRGLGEAVRRGQQAGLRGLQAINQTPGVTPGDRWRSPADRDDRPGRGRQDADHRRSVRRRQGGARRLSHLRGRRPRRRDRARAPGSRRRVSAAQSRSARSWSGLTPTPRAERSAKSGVAYSPNLIGFLGDFELAEEAAQEAFAIAAERWPRDGTPEHPAPGCVTTARNRAIDRIRRDRTFAEKARLLEVPRRRWRTSMDETAIPTSGSSCSSPAATRRSRWTHRWR